jgi:hypothetical protein
MNHMLVQFPCFDFMPATAQYPDFLTPMLAFAVFCALAVWGLHSAFGDWSAHGRRASPPDVPRSKATG